MKTTLVTSSVLLLLQSAISCRQNTAANSSTAGCIDPAKVNKDAYCIESYDLVCGCDGKTYSNSCFADAAGVTAYTKGECPQKK